MSRIGKSRTSKILSHLLLVCLLIGAVPIALHGISDNVAAVTTYTWSAAADSFAGISTSWTPNGVPGAGDSVTFDATSVKNCSWNVTTTLAGFSMNAGYTGTVTQAANFSVTSFDQVAGTLTGSTSYILTDSGNFNGGTLTNDVLQLKTTNADALVIVGTGNLSYLWVTGTTTIGSLTLHNHLKVDAGANLIIDHTQTLSYHTWGGSFSLENAGTIRGDPTFGDGILDLQFYNTNSTITFGVINCSVQIRAISTALWAVTATLGANTVFGSSLTVSSSSAVQTMTLNLSTSNYNLNAGAITVGVRGILLGQASTITCNGNWDTSVGAFSSATSTVNLIATGMLKTNGAATQCFYNLGIGSTARQTALASLIFVKANINVNGGSVNPGAYAFIFNLGTTYSFTGTGTVIASTFDDGTYVASINDYNVAVTFQCLLSIPGLRALSTDVTTLTVTQSGPVILTKGFRLHTASPTRYVVWNTANYPLTITNLDMIVTAAVSATAKLQLGTSAVTVNGNWISLNGTIGPNNNATVTFSGASSLISLSAGQKFHNLTVNALGVQAKVSTTDLFRLDNLTVNAVSSLVLLNNTFVMNATVNNGIITTNSGEIKRLNITGPSTTPLTGYGTFTNVISLNGSAAASYNIQTGQPMGYLRTDRDTTINPFNSHYLRVVPSVTEFVNVTIKSYESEGAYVARWTADSANAVNYSLVLAPIKSYTVMVDNVTLKSVLSDGAGLIAFDYTGPFSAHEFIIFDPNGILNITSAPIITGIMGYAYCYRAGTDMPNGSYSLAGNATWLSIDANGYLNGTPTSAGYYLVNVTVTKAVLTAYLNYSIVTYSDIRIAHNARQPNSYYPNVVKVGNRIYMAYMGASFTTWATTYDGTNWSTPTLIDDNIPPVTDDHGVPSMIRNASGYLHVWYGAHCNQLQYAVSTYPDNTSAWTITSYPYAQDSYPTPMIFPTNQSIYLFDRIGSFNAQQWAFRVSENNGTTWSSLHNIVNQQVIDGLWPYLTFDQIRVNPSTGHYILPFSWDIYNSTTWRWGAYYAYFDFTTYHVYNASGGDQGITIDTMAKEIACVLPGMDSLRSTGQPTPSYRPDGNPVVVLTVLKAGSSLASNQWQEIYMIWNGTAWSGEFFIQNTAYYINPFVIYMETSGDFTLYATNCSVSTGYYEEVSKWHYSSSTGTITQNGRIATQSQHAWGSGWWFGGQPVIGGADQKMLYLSEYYSPPDNVYLTGVQVYGRDTNGIDRFVVNGTRWAGPWGPTFTSTPDTTPVPILTYSYDANLNETTGWNETVFSLTTDAAGITIDGITGVVSGTVTSWGQYNFDVVARSIFGLGTTHQIWTLYIGAVPAPAVTPIVSHIQASFKYATDGLKIILQETTLNGSYSRIWDFGDGTGSTNPYPTHTYAHTGTYTISLTVYDGYDHSSTAKTNIRADLGPTTPLENTQTGWNIRLTNETTIAVSAVGMGVSGAIMIASSFFMSYVPIITVKGRRVIGVLLVAGAAYFFIFIRGVITVGGFG